MKNLIILAALLATVNARADFSYSSTNFKELFNKYRFSQAAVFPWPATYWPYDGGKEGVGINHVPPGHDKSPAQKYDEFFGTGGKAAKWEKDNHTCEGEEKANMKDCKTWYGHCNGWTGAALFNEEPDYDHPITVKNPDTGVTMEFDYMDIKALLSEAWLDVWASFEGTGMTETPGAWIFDPNSKKAKEPAGNNKDLTNYEAYWDVTPRALFMALTNYLGAQKVGIAIERFTGAEIWNQPLIAYRLLPIQGNSDQPITKNGKSLYPVNFGLKLYWASDDIGYDFKRTASLNWTVSDEKFSNDRVPGSLVAENAQDSVADQAVISRYIAFTLFFDKPVTVSADGTKVLTSGKIKGDGVWAHSDPDQKNLWYTKGYEQSQLHPDFIWRPDHLTDADFRNPAIDPAKIYKYILQKPMDDFAPRK